MCTIPIWKRFPMRLEHFVDGVLREVNLENNCIEGDFPPSRPSFANFSIDQDGSPVFDSQIYFGDGYDGHEN